MDSTTAPLSKTARQQSASPLPSKGEDPADSSRSEGAGEIARPKIRFESASVFFKTLWARFLSGWKKESAPSQSVSTGAETVRPKILFDSPSVFFKTFWIRLASIWTKSFMLSLLAGQIVSLCITCTNVTTTELVNRGWALPTTQTFFLYLSLFVTYTPYTIYKYGFDGWTKLIVRDGWKYFILAACDVEGNFLVVKAYQYTDLLSCMLLDAWAIPSCMFFCWVFMRRKYAWSQLAGILICVGGLGMLVGSDHLTDKSWEAVDKVKGDLFMIAGATLYGFTNAAEEFFVRQSPLYEVVGQLGMWGTLINGIQAAGLEHHDMTTATWNGAIGGILVAYTAAMFILYTTAPILYRMATSVFYNLSLLSSDFFGLLFGLFLFHYAPFWLYFVAFAIIICGLICYFWSTTPESEGEVDPQKPSYIKAKESGQSSPENQA